MKSREPETRFRVGSVTASVWKNDGGFHTVTLQRSYKDQKGDWQNTDQLGHSDLLNAAKVLQRAEVFISEQ